MRNRIDIRKVAVEVRDRITDCPESHNQLDWIQPGKPPGETHAQGWYIPFDTREDYLRASAQEWDDCGTTACVAGHIAAVIAREHPEKVIWSDRVLGYGTASTVWKQTKQAVVSTLRSLGLEPSELWVFSHDRTREEVLEWLDTVAAGENPAAASERMKAEQKQLAGANR